MKKTGYLPDLIINKQNFFKLAGRLRLMLKQRSVKRSVERKIVLLIDSMGITLPKRSKLQLSQNYRTVKLIGHSSRVRLKITMNRPNQKPKR